MPFYIIQTRSGGVFSELVNTMWSDREVGAEVAFSWIPVEHTHRHNLFIFMYGWIISLSEINRDTYIIDRVTSLCTVVYYQLKTVGSA